MASESLLTTSLYLSLGAVIFSVAYNLYMAYVNYRQAKAVGIMEENLEVLKEVRDYLAEIKNIQAENYYKEKFTNYYKEKNRGDKHGK